LRQIQVKPRAIGDVIRKLRDHEGLRLLGGVMSDHGEVQYATAAGNDLPAHQASYEMFLQGTFVLIAAVINILFGLTVGAVLGHWLPGAALIIFGVIAAAITAWTGSKTVSFVMVAISGLTLLLNAYS
jgi:hypothetical protein